MQKLISHAWPVVAALVVLFGALAWSAVREKSNTFDEMAHLTGGYSFWHTGDYRLQRYGEAVYLLPPCAAQSLPVALAPGEVVHLPGIGRISLPKRSASSSCR